MGSKFEVYTDKANEFRFRLKAPNGENVLASEGYVQKNSALSGIESVKTNAPHDDRYERRSSTAGPYFVLKAPNHEIIGKSENYSSDAALNNGIDAVKRAAPDAAIVDIS